MAEASELPVTLHDCTGPIVYAASCALSATLPNANYQEAVRAYFTGWYTRDRRTTFRAVADGHVAPLEGPGLGSASGPSSSSGQTPRCGYQALACRLADAVDIMLL